LEVVVLGEHTPDEVGADEAGASADEEVHPPTTSPQS
jgi:hypothetical protein